MTDHFEKPILDEERSRVNRGEITDAGYVAFWGTVRETHAGPFLGIEPTGNEISIMGIGVVRIENRKIAERWANFDMFGMLSQLGISSFDEIPHEW